LLQENLEISRAAVVVEPLFISTIASGTAVGSKIKLSGAEAKHAVSAKRMTKGEAIAVTDGQGLKVRGSVSAVSNEWLEIEVATIEKIPRPATSLVLVQALAKGDRDELAVQAATELGIQGVIPWQSERSISIWKSEKKIKGQLRWQAISAEAAKQSLRPFIPLVEKVVEGAELISRLSAFDLVLILDPTAQNSITDSEIKDFKQVALVVGPEGGISPAELSAFESAGFQRVHMGKGIFRTSTAGVAAVSYLQARLGDWG
jgi:16S rRNA (uracil1498-N3)-methyltransferase